MSGKILITSYEMLENHNLDSYDFLLQIVRYTKKGLYPGFVHVPQLSPSPALFSKTMYRWKKAKFTKEEYIKMRSGKTHTWFDLYEEAFVLETKTRPDFIRAYNRLKYLLALGENIILICYCDNPLRCHRSILAQMLINDGYQIILE